MTKKELARALSSRCGVTQLEGVAMIDIMLDALSDSLASGESIYLRGFGTIEPKVRKTKKARDIGRGMSVMIPTRVKPSFKPSKKLMKRINGNQD